MHNVEIEVYPLAKTQVDRTAVRKWLDHLGANEYEIPAGETATDPALLIALAAKRCYMSFQPGLNPNVSKVRKDMTEYLDNVLKSGHGSVLEHGVWSFAIEGVSRVFTGEMNRHRAGVAISEGSMRFIRFDNIAWWMPNSLRDGDKLCEDGTIEQDACAKHGYSAASPTKKAKSREIFNRAFQQMEQNYTELCDVWGIEKMDKFSQKKILTSCFRRIVGMGCATGGVWSMNIRAVRHILAMRTTEHAEEEIYHVFSKIAEIMVQDEPQLIGDFEQDAQGFWKPKYWKV